MSWLNSAMVGLKAHPKMIIIIMAILAVVIIVIIYAPRKSHFTDPLFQEHEKELSLFKSLSDGDKIKYMNMPREEKIATYGAKLYM